MLATSNHEPQNNYDQGVRDPFSALRSVAFCRLILGVLPCTSARHSRSIAAVQGWVGYQPG